MGARPSGQTWWSEEVYAPMSSLPPVTKQNKAAYMW